MRQGPRTIAYVLLAIVAVISLLHAIAGCVGSLQIDTLHAATLGYPYRFDLSRRVETILPPASHSPIQVGDQVISVNGVPLTNWLSLRAGAERVHAGVPFSIEYRAAKDPSKVRQAIVPVVIRPALPGWQRALAIVLLVVPVLLLLLGLYVVLARPDSLNAWEVLSVLAYPGSLLLPVAYMPTWAVPVGTLWASLAQTAMPLALMWFGVTFPQRAWLDERAPWLKWVLAAPILALYPFDLFVTYSFQYRWAAIASVPTLRTFVDNFEQFISVLAVFYFFSCIARKISASTGDARRRLRILYAGAATGLTPLLVLLIVSVVRRKSLDSAVPTWLLLVCLFILFAFPLSLAYVVVVQRAMDLRILIRQGTQYFFAKQAVWALQALASAWFAYSLVRVVKMHGNARTVDLVTLLGAAALMVAVRRVLSKRLQKTIDRRFFREAYSTELVLSELSDEVRGFTEAAPMLRTVSDRVGSTLHVERIAIFLRDGDSFRLEMATGNAVALSTRWMLPVGSTTINALSGSREPAVVYSDRTASWLVDASDTERAALNDLSAELLVPLPGRNRLIGVMMLGPKQSEQPYSSTDRALLQTLASQTGMALENAELLETLTAETAQRERFSREIEIAREVQERLFPQSYPVLPGVDMAGFCRPAQAVGGDYYDLFAIAGGGASASRLGIAVGDISGKGISASLLMASLRASLRSLSRVQGGGTPELAALMETVNDLVYESSASNRYATFFFAEYDPCTRLLTYVNAGHNPPQLLRGEESLPLEATGMVVGLMQGVHFEQSSILVRPGDMLLAFTDGVSEAETVDAEEWGEERMIAAARSAAREPNCNVDAAHVVRCIVREADRFTGDAPQHDDMTLVACRFIAT